MSNFAKPLKEATKEELEEYRELDPNYAKLASDELIRRELKELKWYQKPWGIFSLGFLSGLFSGVVVAILLNFIINPTP